MAALVSVRSVPAVRAGQPTPYHIRAARALGKIWQAWQNRRAFYRLGELSDSELADIGLRRADLSVAMTLPLSVDPTAHLGTLASSRLRPIEDSAREVC